MFVDNIIKPVELTHAAGMNNSHQSSESFQDILKRKLNSKSKNRPPKIELTGVLIPCHQECGGQTFRFKLGTQTNEYLLSIKHNLVDLATKASWEEITVRGVLDDERNIFEGEKMILKQSTEDDLVPVEFREPVFDADTYVRMIGQRGKLEPALDSVAS